MSSDGTQTPCDAVARLRRPSSPATAAELLELTPRTLVWQDAAGFQAAGEFEHAERLYRELLETEPESTDLVLYHLGVVSEARMDFDAAAAHYTAAERNR